MGAQQAFRLPFEGLASVNLAQTPLLHVHARYLKARAVAGLWGSRSL